MPVSDIARENVVTVDPGSSLYSVANRMQETSVGSVVVVDDGEPIGIVSERDLALAVLVEDWSADRPVEGLLSDDIVTVGPNLGIYELVELFSTKGIQRVPVVDEGRMIGLVTLSDVVVLLGMELQHVANAIRTIAPAYEHSPVDLYE